MSKVKILLLRRWYMVGGAALLAAAAIFYTVNYPASVSAAATTRQLPIYSVERSQKVCAISFDAAWGNEDTQTLIDILARSVSRPPSLLWEIGRRSTRSPSKPCTTRATR